MQTISHCRLMIIVLMIVAVIQACARSVPEVRHVVVNARFSILIASDASDFKDAVRHRVFEHFKTFSNVEVVNINRLKTIKADDFDAVLIIDTCLGWSRFNPTMKSFIDAAQDPSHVILFMTVDDTEWEYTYRGVDAMTSASVIEDEERVAADLIQKVDDILEASII